MESSPIDTREADWDLHFPYVLWDYYCQEVTDGKLTLAEARQFYLEDMGQQDGAA